MYGESVPERLLLLKSKKMRLCMVYKEGGMDPLKLLEQGMPGMGFDAEKKVCFLVGYWC